MITHDVGLSWLRFTFTRIGSRIQGQYTLQLICTRQARWKYCTWSSVSFSCWTMPCGTIIPRCMCVGIDTWMSIVPSLSRSMYMIYRYICCHVVHSITRMMKMMIDDDDIVMIVLDSTPQITDELSSGVHLPCLTLSRYGPNSKHCFATCIFSRRERSWVPSRHWVSCVFFACFACSNLQSKQSHGKWARCASRCFRSSFAAGVGCRYTNVRANEKDLILLWYRAENGPDNDKEQDADE